MRSRSRTNERDDSKNLEVMSVGCGGRPSCVLRCQRAAARPRVGDLAGRGPGALQKVSIGSWSPRERRARRLRLREAFGETAPHREKKPARSAGVDVASSSSTLAVHSWRSVPSGTRNKSMRDHTTRTHDGAMPRWTRFGSGVACLGWSGCRQSPRCHDRDTAMRWAPPQPASTSRTAADAAPLRVSRRSDVTVNAGAPLHAGRRGTRSADARIGPDTRPKYRSGSRRAGLGNAGPSRLRRALVER